MRTSEHRPSTALIAIGAFLLVLITGATALLYVGKQPTSPPQASGQPQVIESDAHARP